MTTIQKHQFFQALCLAAAKASEHGRNPKACVPAASSKPQYWLDSRPEISAVDLRAMSDLSFTSAFMDKRGLYIETEICSALPRRFIYLENSEGVAALHIFSDN